MLDAVCSSLKITTVLVQDSTASVEDGTFAAITIFPLLSRLTFFCRYAMERTNDYIKVWFWERGDKSAPFDATSGALIIDTNNWVAVLASLVVLGIHGLSARELLQPIFLTPTVTSSLTSMPTILLST